ncbi:GAF domain-containing protein [Chloroflexota bacterium]
MMEEKEIKYYHSLYEIAAALNSADTPDYVLHVIVRSVADALDVKGCSLMLLTPDHKVLLHTVSYGLSDWYVRKGPVSADRSISEALKGRAVAVVNATEDDRIQYRDQASQEGIASILSLPMVLRDEVIGVLRVYSAEQYYFTDPDIYFAGAVANLGAIALENARLYDSVKKNYEAVRLELAEWVATLGYEWAAEESVLPPK